MAKRNELTKAAQGLQTPGFKDFKPQTGLGMTGAAPKPLKLNMAGAGGPKSQGLQTPGFKDFKPLGPVGPGMGAPQPAAPATPTIAYRPWKSTPPTGSKQPPAPTAPAPAFTPRQAAPLPQTPAAPTGTPSPILGAQRYGGPPKATPAQNMGVPEDTASAHTLRNQTQPRPQGPTQLGADMLAKSMGAYPESSAGAPSSVGRLRPGLSTPDKARVGGAERSSGPVAKLPEAAEQANRPAPPTNRFWQQIQNLESAKKNRGGDFTPNPRSRATPEYQKRQHAARTQTMQERGDMLKRTGTQTSPAQIEARGRELLQGGKYPPEAVENWKKRMELYNSGKDPSAFGSGMSDESLNLSTAHFDKILAEERKRRALT